jgi:hypothetical protein
MKTKKFHSQIFTILLVLCSLLTPSRGVFAETNTEIEDQVQLLKNLNRTTEETSQRVNRFFQDLGFNISSSHTFSVKIFNDHQKMLGEIPQNVAKDSSVLGYYQHGNHEIGVWYGGNMHETQRILRHELTHKGLHQSLQFTPPAWLDEGFAELLSRDLHALRDLNPQGIPTIVQNVLREANNNGKMVQLSDLFQLDNNTFYGENQELHYALSYTVIAYILDQQGPRVLGNLIHATKNGEDITQWLQTRVFNGQKENPREIILGWALNS